MDERARARNLMEGVDDRKDSKTELSMAAEWERWQRGTSISFRDCQSGRADDKAMNATVSFAKTEVGGGWPSRPSTRGVERTEES